MKVSESLLKYLAGLCDADGCLSFSFTPDHRRPNMYALGLQLTISSSDAVDKQCFMETLPSLTNMGKIFRSGKSRQFISWQVRHRSDLEKLLPRLTKHMVLKARHWHEMLERWRAQRQKPIGDRAITLEERDSLRELVKGSRRALVGPLKPKNHPTWAWLAGYLDGDGCYHFTRIHPKKNDHLGSYHIRVSSVAHVNDIYVLQFLQNAFGGRICDHSQSLNVKIWYRNLGVSDKSFALRFLPKLVKHSRLKRHKIEQMIHYLASHVSTIGPNAMHRHQQRLSVSAPKGEAIV